MKRSMLVIALFAAATAVLVAQEASPSGPYTGTSNPPPDVSVPNDAAPQDSSGNPPPGVTGYEQPAPIPPPAKPPAGHPATAPAQPAPPAAQYDMQPPAANAPAPAAPMANPADGTDDGIVIVGQNAPNQPELNQRDSAMMSDPDGDIVHPGALQPGALGYGAIIRVRLLESLSTAYSQRGETFRTQVASDVLQNGQVLIPAGAEIDGTIASVSSGHAGGHGSMHLRPDTVILPNGSRFHLYAQLTGAPGSSLRVNGEGSVAPGSQLKKDGIEYGGAVGAGLITGAILGGPGGALAGTIIGAGVISVHLLVSHPQATLDRGTVLLFTLNEPLNLVPATQSGN